MNVLFIIIAVLLSVFVVSSLVGLFRARSDIKKNKNEDSKYRLSRKDVIEEKRASNSAFPDSSILFNQLANLTDSEKEQFRAELAKRLSGGA